MEEANRENINNEAEHRLEEVLYILHQADLRCINAMLKKGKKGKNESSALPAG